MKPEHRPLAIDEFVFDVKIGFVRARKLLPRRALPTGADPYRSAARVIVDHLELAGFRCCGEAPLKAHSVPADMDQSSPDAG